MTVLFHCINCYVRHIKRTLVLLQKTGKISCLLNMEPDEGETYPKQGTTRSEKNTTIDYDEDRVRLDLTNPV